MKIIILNANSLLNPGDAAILSAQVDLLRKLRPGCEIAITSRTPDLDRSFFGPRGVVVHPAFLPAPSLWPGIGRKLAGTVGHAARLGDKARLVKAIRSADLVVASGGGVFFSNRRFAPGLTFRQNIFHVRLAQALGKPVLFFPQSFGPFGSAAARRSVSRILGHPRTLRILVREAFSAETLSRMPRADIRGKIEPCPDMAFGFRPAAGSGDPRLEALPRPRLILVARDWDFPEAANPEERRALRERYLESLRAAALAFARGRGGSVALLPHTRGPGAFEDDRFVLRRLHEELSRDLSSERLALLDPPDECPPQDLLARYAQADLILATRTHSSLFGLLSGRPVVSIHYQPKGPGILAGLGLSERTIPIAGLDARRLISALEEALAQTPAETARIAGCFARLRSEVEDRIGRVIDEAERSIIKSS